MVYYYASKTMPKKMSIKKGRHFFFVNDFFLLSARSKKMLVKICDNCGRRLKQNESCRCRHRLYDKTQRNQEKAKLYHSPAWSKIVKRVKERANGLDEYELANGRLCKGNLAHHIYTIEDRPDLKLTLSNLIYVSNATHNMIHGEYEKGGEQKQKMQKKLMAIREGR